MDDNSSETSIIVTSGPAGGGSGGGPIQMDNENLRRKLALQREENTVLMRQNQDLLQSMEKLTWEFSKAQGKIRSFDGDRNSSSLVTTLKEKLFRLEADNKGLEDRLGEYQRLLEGASNEKVDWKTRLDHSNQDLKTEREMRMKAESDHRACVTALEEAQRQVSRLSEETRGRLNDAEVKVRGLESQLREARTVEQQRRDIANRLSSVEDERNRLRRAAKECEQKDMEIISLRTEVARLKQRAVQREAEADASSAARVDAETRVGKEAARADALQVEILRVEEERDRAKQESLDWRRQMEEGCTKLSQLEKNMDALSQNRSSDVQRLSEEIEALRQQLMGRDEEIERMKLNQQTAHKAEGETRGELEAAQVQLGSLRSQLERSGERARELEHLVARHEDDGKRSSAELAHLRQENARLSCELASTEQRLTLRDNRVADLTKEADKFRESDSKLDKELRSAQTRTAGLESKVSELTSALDDAVSKSRLSEEKVQRSEATMSDLRAEHQLRGRQLEEVRSELSATRSQHTNQLRERQQMAEELTSRLERLRGERQILTAELERQKSARVTAEGEVVARDKRISKLEAEMSEQARRSDSALQTLERRAANGSEHMQKLQQELKCCMSELQDLYASQQWYESELRAAKSAAESAKSLADESTKAVSERQKRLEAGQRRIETLEQQLNESLAINLRIGELEGQLDERQRLLDAAQNRAAQSEAELRRTKESIHDLDSEVEQRRSELAAVSRELSNLRMEHDCARDEHDRELAARTKSEKSLRAELSLLDAELTKVVRERDESLHIADCGRQREQDLEQRAIRAETELQATRDEIRRLSVQCETARSQLQARNERLSEVEGNLRNAESLAADRNRDVTSLEGTLRMRTAELEKRAAQLRNLEVDVATHTREHNALVANLERELSAAKEQIGNQAKLMAEEAIEQESMQASLQEKTDIMRLAELKLKQLSKELEKRGKRNRELQNDVAKMAEERNSLLEEVRGMKNETLSLAGDLKVLKERLMNVEREKERLSECLADSTELLKTKGEETEAMAEEINSLKVKHAQAESRADADLRHLRRQLDDLKVERHTEIGNLKENNHELLSCKNRELEEMSKRMRTVEAEMKRGAYELERRDQSVGQLQERIRDQEKALRDASETITVKNSAIARLETKLSQLARKHGVQLQEIINSGPTLSRPSSPQRMSPAVSFKPPPSPTFSLQRRSPSPARHTPIASDDPGIQDLLNRVNARITGQEGLPSVQRSAEWSETMGEVSELESEDEPTPELEITSPAASRGVSSPSLAERELEATEAKLAALQARLQKVQTVAEQDAAKKS